MFLEFLGQFFSLNFAWVGQVFLDHLFWLFVLAAFVVISLDSKKHLWGFIFFVFFLWTFTDLNFFIGWNVPAFFGPVFFILVAVPSFAFLEKNGKLSKYNLPFQAGACIFLWAFFTFFIWG